MIRGHSRIISDCKRLADTGNLGHAYLFHGPAMTGKKLVAYAFANYLELGEFSKPKGILRDFLPISPGENGSIGIDEALRIKGFLWQKPVASPRRTLVVDQAERMTEEAQNAVLKIAEEPPRSSLLILVTGDMESLRSTLTSRLAKIYFSPVTAAEISKWLEKEAGMKKEEAEKLAQMSCGEPGSENSTGREAAGSDKVEFLLPGKPGLAWALKNDKKLQELLKSAEELLKVTSVKKNAI